MSSVNYYYSFVVCKLRVHLNISSKTLLQLSVSCISKRIFSCIDANLPYLFWHSFSNIFSGIQPS